MSDNNVKNCLEKQNVNALKWLAQSLDHNLNQLRTCKLKSRQKLKTILIIAKHRNMLGGWLFFTVPVGTPMFVKMLLKINGVSRNIDHKKKKIKKYLQ